MWSVKNIFAGAVVAGLVLAIVGCGKSTPTATSTASTKASTMPAIPAVPVKVRAAEARDLQRSVRVVANLAGLEKATLSNRVTGTVEAIYADLGDRVKPGAELLRIAPARFEYALKESQAALAQTLARLGQDHVPTESEKFDIKDTAIVRKAQSELDNAKSKLERQAPLHKQGMIKDFEFFDTQNAVRVAESALSLAYEDARALLAQSRQDEQQIKIRQKDFDDTAIRAPLETGKEAGLIKDYAVMSRKVSVGEYLREGTALFTVVADGVLKLQARVPERYLGKVMVGEKVKFHVESYPEEFEGTVSRLEPSVDESNRTFMVEALVPNAEKYGGRLRPGSFVQGEILTKLERGCVMVPLEAVTSFVGVNKIYVVEDKERESGEMVAHAIEVTTGQQEGNWIEVRATIAGQELKAGQQVVYDGASKLVDGSKVVLKKLEPLPAASAASSLSQKD